MSINDFDVLSPCSNCVSKECGLIDGNECEKLHIFQKLKRATEKQFNTGNSKREFYIDTPIGKLKVYAKHKKDCPADFPGVFVDLVRDGDEDVLIACVEFDSCEKNLLATIYGQLYNDSPTDIRHIDVSNSVFQDLVFPECMTGKGLR